MVDRLVAELRDLAKRAAIDQVNAAFGNSMRSVAAPSHAPASSAPQRGGGRVRRGNDEIEALRGKLLSAITNKPGLRAEDINAALGTQTAQIAQPLRRLVAEKAVRTEGARRGTRYFISTGSNAEPSPPQPIRRQSSEAAAMAASVAAAAAAATAASSVQGEDTAS